MRIINIILPSINNIHSLNDIHNIIILSIIIIIIKLFTLQRSNGNNKKMNETDKNGTLLYAPNNKKCVCYKDKCYKHGHVK